MGSPRYARILAPASRRGPRWRWRNPISELASDAATRTVVGSPKASPRGRKRSRNQDSRCLDRPLRSGARGAALWPSRNYAVFAGDARAAYWPSLMGTRGRLREQRRRRRSALPRSLVRATHSEQTSRTRGRVLVGSVASSRRTGRGPRRRRAAATMSPRCRSLALRAPREPNPTSPRGSRPQRSYSHTALSPRRRRSSRAGTRRYSPWRSSSRCGVRADVRDAAAVMAGRKRAAQSVAMMGSDSPSRVARSRPVGRGPVWAWIGTTHGRQLQGTRVRGAHGGRLPPPPRSVRPARVRSKSGWSEMSERRY